MVKQYPHTIKLTTVSGMAQDGNGNWTGGTSSEVTKDCRYEPNSKGAFITSPDGTRIDFDGTVYMPLPVDQIPPGTRAEVKYGSVVLSNNSVKRFSAGQLNARLWL